MEQSLKDLDKAFEAMLKKFPDARRELVENAGEKMQRKVLQNISTTTKEVTGHLLEGVTLDIGSGGGHNWWCVLYPGLCSFAQGGYALPAENDLVCGQYILRFRLVDWAHRLTAQRQTVLLAG